MHEAAVAFNIRRKNGSELPLGRGCNNGVLLPSTPGAATKAGTKGTRRKASASADSKR
jgi:hypothetical protein